MKAKFAIDNLRHMVVQPLSILESSAAIAGRDSGVVEEIAIG